MRHFSYKHARSIITMQFMTSSSIHKLLNLGLKDKLEARESTRVRNSSTRVERPTSHSELVFGFAGVVSRANSFWLTRCIKIINMQNNDSYWIILQTFILFLSL
jgi:hypothetical protein